jgi:periplasmic copper chaperone A
VRSLALALALAAMPAWAQVSVEEPWARATPPGAKIGAAYMTLRNRSPSADRLIGAASPAAARVELHVTEKKGEVLRMRQVKAYDVPAGGSFALAPSGAHLMLVDIKAPLKEGTKVPLVLRFEKSGEVKVELRVRALTTSGQDHSHQH